MNARLAVLLAASLSWTSCSSSEEPVNSSSTDSAQVDSTPVESDQASHSSVLIDESADSQLIAWERLDTPAEADITVGWTEADQYVGQVIAVEGKIVDTYNSGRACFLNFSTEWQGKFYLAIIGSSLNDYPESPERYFKDKTVRAVGKVKMYQGRPQIVIDTPQHVTVLE